jgi:hypothetical protein
MELTDKEKEFMDMILDLENAYRNLPFMYPPDNTKMYELIDNMRCRILARVACRELNYDYETRFKVE